MAKPCGATVEDNDPPLTCTEQPDHPASHHWDAFNGWGFPPEDAD